MRFRLGFVSGFATGYVLGAKAGRQRYEELDRAFRKLKRSETYEKAKEALDEGIDKAKEIVKDKVPIGGGDTAGGGTTGPNGTADGSPHGTNTIPAAAPLTGKTPAAPPT